MLSRVLKIFHIFSTDSISALSGEVVPPRKNKIKSSLAFVGAATTFREAGLGRITSQSRVRVAEKLGGLWRNWSANISLTVSSLSFGDVRVGSSKTQNFTVTNNGDKKVTISIFTPYGFGANPSYFSLDPKGMRSIQVTFTPSFQQSYSGSMSVGGASSVWLSGKGISSSF